jgi:hypothetical protein
LWCQLTQVRAVAALASLNIELFTTSEIGNVPDRRVARAKGVAGGLHKAFELEG